VRVVDEAETPRGGQVEVAGAGLRPAGLQAWLRVTDPLPDDQHTHACALVYMSDLTLSHAIVRPHGGFTSRMALTSLDHAAWFHRPFRADEWLLFDQSSPSAAHERGLAIGEVFDTEGVLVATIVQEALLRAARP
jgi:acyl-CoA thioesterase-2